MVDGGDTLLRWIVLLPLLSAAAHGVLLALLRRPLPRLTVILMSCGTVGLAFLISFWELIVIARAEPGERLLADNLFTWIGSGAFSAEAAFLLDPLSAVMCLVVTGVGLLIHVYSVGYMDEDHRDDRGFQRFFCYLNLFTFSMLVLVLADNLLLMFLGWEGVGLCSYLLIGFWYSDRWNAACGAKAFIVNRVGDFGFLVGIFLLFWSLFDAGQGAVAFRDIQAAFPAIAEQTVTLPGWLGFLPGAPEWKLASVIGLCFLLGAAGKSAQLPLYVWLPDAMAGPTPVSALIHAATMVTAGVYLVCRMSFLYAAAPGASMTLAWVGAITALFAAVVAVAQTDIKKVLAYSTVSQLGYMFLAAGCGAYSAAIFHVVTHAFFKALLFLGAGAVILAMHHEQDTDRMGGLHELIPWTHWTFLAGIVAIVGVPYTSGFFSKDEILLAANQAHAIPGHEALYAIALLTAGLTAFYMFRLYFRTFWGRLQAPLDLRGQIHDPPMTVLVPLALLAVLALFGGLLGPSEAFIPLQDANSLGHFLAPVMESVHHDVSHGTERRLALLAVGVAASGGTLAWWLYLRRPELPARIDQALGFVSRTVRNKFYVDEIYDAVIVRPILVLSEAVLYRGIDTGVIDDGAVNGVGRVARSLAGDVLKHLQSGLTQSYLFIMVVGVIAIVGFLVR